MYGKDSFQATSIQSFWLCFLKIWFHIAELLYELLCASVYCILYFYRVRKYEIWPNLLGQTLHKMFLNIKLPSEALKMKLERYVVEISEALLQNIAQRARGGTKPQKCTFIFKLYLLFYETPLSDELTTLQIFSICQFLG